MTRLLSPTLALAAALLLAGLRAPADGAEPAWELVRRTDDGIDVYMREWAGSTLRQAKAVCLVAAPPATVIEAAADPDTFKVSTKYVSANRLERTADPNVWYLYQLLAYPVVSPRDYALRYEQRIDAAKGVYRLSWKVTDTWGPKPGEGVIRVTRADGRIDAKPLADGKRVLVTYDLVADPGGSIPGWVMRIAQRFNLPEIMRELRAEAQRRAAATARR